MKTDYEDRIKNRIARYQEAAIKARQESSAMFASVQSIQKMIPMGQPILRGHHSEKHHLAHLKKIDNGMRKSIELEKKADYYDQRVLAAHDNTAISSDNPEAKDLLDDKVESMEKFRDNAKRVNKELKAGKTIFEMDFLTKEDKDRFISYIKFDGHIPTYFFSNLGAKIRNAKSRKSQIESIEKLEEKEVTWNGVKVIQSPSKNRFQLIFPCKPPQETIRDLKSSGFRWSPTEKAWQRHLTNSAIYAAKDILKK